MFLHPSGKNLTGMVSHCLAMKVSNKPTKERRTTEELENLNAFNAYYTHKNKCCPCHTSHTRNGSSFIMHGTYNQH
jgi:cytochrome c peroxidase